MRVFDPDPNLRWLFCMTHPDDEISICAWIARLAQVAPERVWMSWTHSNPIREREARAVLELLRVPGDQSFFHGATDGAVCEEIASLRPAFEAMIEAVRPDRIVCGAFEQGHLDHDATNYLVHQSFKGLVVEVPFYHPYLTRMPRVNRFADTTGQEILHLEKDESVLKKRVARSYPSQAIWRNMVCAEVRACLTGDGSLLRTERARFQVHTDFRRPNLPANLSSRVEVSSPWARWIAAVDRAESGTDHG